MTRYIGPKGPDAIASNTPRALTIPPEIHFGYPARIRVWKGILRTEVSRIVHLACVLLLTACASNTSTVPPTASDTSFRATLLAKTDIDRVAEAQQREIFANLRLLTEKLYRRNPRELQKSGQASVAAGVARIFEGPHEWKFPELRGNRDTHAIRLAFREDYQGDRVLAFVAGVASMIQTAFNDKTEFFVFDELEPQALYNAARNVEIAVWKLSTNRTAQRQLFLLSNEAGAVAQNLSYEREFGKIIGNLDVLSKIVADKNNRRIVKVVQSLATAVFLPIK
jgi:hypothetical protein